VKVPEELAAQLWFESADKPSQCNTFRAHVFAQKIAEWAADQELEACCKWTAIVGGADALRAARRPKPPSLAEQGLKALGSPVGPNHVQFLTAANQDAIRAALNRLAELEAQQ
jgi:hypothetical protein